MRDRLEERRVDRRVDHDLIPRLGRDQQDLEDAPHHVRNDEDPTRVELLLPAPGGEGRERLGQPIPRHVPRVAPLDQLRQRVTDRLRQPHIHLGHPQRHHVRLLEPPLDAAPPPELIQGQVKHHGSTLGPA
jgi:hypothetical protein